MFPPGNCLVSLEIDEGTFGGYFWEGGETTDSCSREEISQDSSKLASSKNKIGNALPFSFQTLGCLLVT